MIIGFDGKRAVNNMTGLGNYSRLVIEEMGKRCRHLRNLASDNTDDSEDRSPAFAMHAGRRSDAAPDWSLLVYTPKMRRNPRLEAIRRLDNVEFRFPPAMGFKGALWRSFGLSNSLQADGVNIFHGLSNELPLNIRSAGVPSVVTVHDLIYRRLPSCYTLPDRVIYDFKYSRACRNADRIIAVSECTKRDIVDLYKIDPDKIDVIYQGCDDIFRADYSKADLADARRRLGLPDRFIVQVGTVEARKNLELTLRALSALPADVCIVVVGRDHHGYKPRMLRLVEELGIARRVLWLEGVDFRDLPLIYRLADVACYPSRYEGFGIPIIESLESGTPVVAATGSCLEEAGGRGALYVSPDSPHEMRDAIRQLLSDPDLRQATAHEGRAHVRRFDNSRMADNIMETYCKCISEYNAGKSNLSPV